MIQRQAERRKLERLAAEYRKRGYKVIVLPNEAQLPEFLSGTAPDMMATSSGDKVIIEVKTIRDLQKASDLSAIAARIEENPQWRFELVTIKNPPQETAPQRRWNINAVRVRLREAKRLSLQGHAEAAYLLAYAAAEGALFAWVERNEVGSSLESAIAIVKRMVVSGALSHRDLSRFERLAAKRHALAHGISSVKITPSDLRGLTTLGDNVLAAAAVSGRDTPQER